jgi:hypothetical protein
MARLMKHTQVEAKKYLRWHIKRGNPNPSNKQINKSKSHENYEWSRGDDWEYYEKRISQLHVHNRKDVKTIVEVVCTAPADLDPQNYRRFFDEVYKFLDIRLGGQNCENLINATVHMDETTPHIHYMAIPAVPNTKGYGGKKERVCAKNLITKHFLKTMHPDLQKHMNEAGILCSVVTGTSEGRSIPLKEYKKLKEKERQLAEREQQLIEREKKLEYQEQAHQRRRQGVFIER